jgi:hypothetical protein
MSAHPPPVPPEQRSDKANGAAPTTESGPSDAEHATRKENTSEQGRQGNLRQNTTNKGFQQDR